MITSSGDKRLGRMTKNKAPDGATEYLFQFPERPPRPAEQPPDSAGNHNPVATSNSDDARARTVTKLTVRDGDTSFRADQKVAKMTRIEAGDGDKEYLFEYRRMGFAKEQLEELEQHKESDDEPISQKQVLPAGWVRTWVLAFQTFPLDTSILAGTSALRVVCGGALWGDYGKHPATAQSG